ncbi:hypothetical protein BpHYR1_017517 [Brachionus plicatilis]|uniref:SWIM-type domain-containing protein n=1 Tax=Brachionus plicatilis TaxID=10195 RepID=A0A3M7T460_BRAPC|nr:hypothetical protein BpHYR1_017517 [Brachionus plicatilis]
MSQENSESSTTSLVRREDEYDEANQTDNDADELPTKKFRGSSKPYDSYKTYENREECIRELSSGQIEQTTWAKKEKKMVKQVKNFRSYKIIEINEQVWELSECSCQNWKKNYICKHVIGISYKLYKFDTFPALDLNIEQNSKRGRRKKASSALQRNSTGPLNRDAFNMPTQLVSISETNDSQPVINELTNQSAPTKRPRGRPRKNKN